MAGQQQQTGKQAAAAAAAERAARTTLTTTEPKRRSLKIWVGMQAELERACVVGQVETACSTNPLGCVGYRQSVWAGLVVAVESVHGYLTCVLLVTGVLQATSWGVRRASHERASHGPAWVVEREGVRGWVCAAAAHAGGTPVVHCPRSRAHDRWSSAASSNSANGQPVSAGRGPVTWRVAIRVR